MNKEELIERCGIHGIIHDGDMFLLIKRSPDDENDPGCWDLPGGGLDKGEEIFAGYMREVEEETGLRIKNSALIGSYTSDDGRLQLCVISDFGAGEIQLSREHTEYKWVSEEVLKSIKPAGLHLIAAQYFVRTKKKIIKYGDLAPMGQAEHQDEKRERDGN